MVTSAVIHPALCIIAGLPQTTSAEALKVTMGIIPLNLAKKKKKELRLNDTIKVNTDETHPAYTSFR